jgi:hypothetical protein
MSSAGVDLLNWSFTGHYLHETLGVTALSPRGLRALVPHQLGIKVERSVSIYRPVDEVRAISSSHFHAGGIVGEQSAGRIAFIEPCCLHHELLGV